ncbi:hypothetical protein ACFL3U_02575 [Pseudomonadota bacterium]
MTTTAGTQKRRWSPTPLDYLAIIAGLINAVVIGTIVGYWLLN